MREKVFQLPDGGVAHPRRDLAARVVRARRRRADRGGFDVRGVLAGDEEAPAGPVLVRAPEPSDGASRHASFARAGGGVGPRAADVRVQRGPLRGGDDAERPGAPRAPWLRVRGVRAVLQRRGPAVRRRRAPPRAVLRDSRAVRQSRRRQRVGRRRRVHVPGPAPVRRRRPGLVLRLGPDPHARRDPRAVPGRAPRPPQGRPRPRQAQARRDRVRPPGARRRSTSSPARWRGRSCARTTATSSGS